MNPKSGEPDDGYNFRFQSRDSSNGFRLDPHGEETKLTVLQGDNAFAEQVLSVIRQWHTIGKPKRAAFQFIVENDGRQVVHVQGTDAQFEV